MHNDFWNRRFAEEYELAKKLRRQVAETTDLLVDARKMIERMGME